MKLKNIIQKIKPFIRGILKSIPFGSVIVEAADNIKTEIEINKSVTPTRSKLDNEGNPTTPHNWLSIFVQLIGASLLVYAFVEKLITIEQVLEYLKQLTK